ncbi:DUF4279 domain-containing protein [Streptomyces rimosus]|uniref:DUF4279 domain-containing protein n=1 Tax=Streptomyces rimosus TaxID=1927 RepID=UPI0004C22409|nr:DUF4279 domain-containing protein [Streptomyces rimosus]
MLLEQYVYFALSSERMSAREMTVLLGVQPDETSVRGSRSSQPAVPVCHRWKIVCREPGLRVDEQIAHVLDRLRPHTDRIAGIVKQLADEPGAEGTAVLEVVRYFSDAHEPGDDGDNGDDEQSGTEKPNLLGWSLDRKVLEFLAVTGAVLDVDEYDMTG